MADTPDNTELLRQAIPHHNAGRLAEAEAIYRQILSRSPNHPDALNLLGIIAGQTGHPETGVELISRAISISPATPLYYQSLAQTYRQMGKLELAAANLRQALQLNPGSAISLDRLGSLAREMGRLEEAVGLFQQFAVLSPQSPEGFNNIGVCLKELGRSDEAIVAYRKALALNPDFVEVHNNLGVCLKDAGNVDEAIAEYRQAIRLKPDFVEAHNNLGTALLAKARPDEAEAALRDAVALQPDFGGAHYNLAIALLQMGRFSQGWREYEWRWRTEGFPSGRREFNRPQWDGGDLRGRTILVHCEQGFGDSIQFIRYVPLLHERGAKVILCLPPELERLLRTVEGVSAVITSTELPRFDVHCPLMSLPGLFGTTLDSIPARIPYLHADPELSGQWKQRLDQHGAARKIGIAWAGRPTHGADAQRSMGLGEFRDLAEGGRDVFVSLQKGDAAAQAGNPPMGMTLIDPSGDLRDFAETAALIDNLDLVISVDSAVAHLAGAMGKPVWLLLPTAPDWRWLLDRSDSPWYPTMRLFRQIRAGDWAGPMAAVREALLS